MIIKRNPSLEKMRREAVRKPRSRWTPRGGGHQCSVDAQHPSSATQHKAMIHDIDVTYHYCDEIGCDYKAKEASTVKKHKAAIHDIDVTYYYCDQKGCDYKAKKAGNVKTHKSAIHDIDVIYYLCNQKGTSKFG
jgi:hypothetical protein